MKRVVAIGELLIDFLPQEKGCALRDVVRFERRAGGAPANVVTAVSCLGGEGAMISQVGKDAFGEYILEVLRQNGVDTRYVFQTDRAHTGLAFVSLDAGGDREFSFFRNPSADLLLAPEQIEEAMLDNCGTLHFCSVDLVDSPMKQATKKLIELAKRKQLLISFDPNVRLPLWNAPEACQSAIREFLPYADLVKLSDDELEFVTGCRDDREAAEMLFRLGCRMLLVTKGANGSAVYTKNAHASYGVVAGPVVDTTGAGDSFIGSFLFQLMRDCVKPDTLEHLNEKNLKDYLRFSAGYAALTVAKKGAVMASMNEMIRRNTK